MVAKLRIIFEIAKYSKKKDDLYLVVQTGALNGVWTDFFVGHFHMFGMGGIAFEGFLAHEGAVKHHIGIG